MRRSILAVAALVGISGSLAGQVCQGMASFASGPMRLGANAGFRSHANDYGAEFGIGGASGLFASAGVLRTNIDNVSGAANAVKGAVGYAFDLTPTKTAQFCPVASVGYDRGPAYQTNVGYARNTTGTYGLAGSFGGVAASSGIMDFVPFVGLDYVHSSVDASLSGLTRHFTFDDKNFDIGAGFVFNHRVTVRPSARYGISPAAGYAYTLAFALNFGAISPTK